VPQNLSRARLVVRLGQTDLAFANRRLAEGLTETLPGPAKGKRWDTHVEELLADILVGNGDKGSHLLREHGDRKIGLALASRLLSLASRETSVLLELGGPEDVVVYESGDPSITSPITMFLEKLGITAPQELSDASTL
jgi:hypothetical protein